MYLARKEYYLTKILTRDEYRKFVGHMAKHHPEVWYMVEKLDDTFKVMLDDTPLTFWGEVLEKIQTD